MENEHMKNGTTELNIIFNLIFHCEPKLIPK